MPSSSREFQRAARQRLTTAEFLFENDYTLDATYLAGYTVECSLKALILRLTPAKKQPEMLKKISSGKLMHDPEILNGILKNLKNPIPLALIKGLRKAGWSTDLRYEFGRRDRERTQGFLKTAKEVYDWVQGQLP
jgi:HEPN domain-containing protein